MGAATSSTPGHPEIPTQTDNTESVISETTQNLLCIVVRAAAPSAPGMLWGWGLGVQGFGFPGLGLRYGLRCRSYGCRGVGCGF
jgi:hypothetical protein